MEPLTIFIKCIHPRECYDKKSKKSIFWKCSPIPDIVRSKLTINSQWVKRYTSSRPNIIVNPLVNNTDNNLRNFTQVWGGRASSVYRPERTVWKHDHQTRRLVFACLTRSKSRIQNGSHISRRGIRRSHEKTMRVKPATHFEIYTPIAAIGKYRQVCPMQRLRFSSIAVVNHQYLACLISAIFAGD